MNENLERSETQSSAPPQEPSDGRASVTPSYAASSHPQRLSILSLGVALGLTGGATVFLIGIATGLFGWGEFVVQVLSSLYIGYEPSIVGSIAGGVWAFVHGFFVGAFIAWFYNKLIRIRR
ncbi:MAG: bacteriophage holin [Rhodospirillales bacterium]